MQSIQKPDGWWITGLPDCEDCGPYPTKERAEDDRRGLERTYRHHAEPGFVTCCGPTAPAQQPLF